MQRMGLWGARLTVMRVAVLVVTLGLVITACRPAPGQGAGVYGNLERLDPRGRVVTLWYPYTGSRAEAFLALVDDFNTSNDWNITILGEYAGSEEELYNRVITGIPTGQVPDVVLASPDQASAYVGLGALVELTPYIESERWGFDEDEWADFFPFVVQGEPLPGHAGRYGFPFGRSMEVLFYNVEWLNLLGYDHPPATWEEFRRMACAAADPAAGTYGYTLSVSAPSFADWLAHFGGGLMDEESVAYTLGGEAGLEALAFLRDLLADGCAALETEAAGSREDFAAGRVLFAINGTSALSSYHRAVDRGVGFDWSIAPLPSLQEASPVGLYGADLSIFRTAPERQLAAWLFLRWLVEPAQQARWVYLSGDLPVRPSVAELLEEYFAANPQYQVAFGLLNSEAIPQPAVPGYADCQKTIRRMLEAVARGADPRASQEWAVGECNDSLGEAASGS
jgi:multiple sugar transport system substrate-binding protein